MRLDGWTLGHVGGKLILIKMKKIIIIVVALLMVAIGLFVFFGLFRAKNNPATNTTGVSGVGALGTVNLPSQSITPSVMSFPGAPQGATFAIGTPQGLVAVKNFYNSPLVLDEEFLILENTSDYQITYDTENNQFFVYASSSPLEAARQEGESALLSLLGISKQDACKLNVVDGFPQGSSMANVQEGLSFCSSSDSAF